MVNEQPQIGYLVKQAQSLLRLRMEQVLEPIGLTVTQYSTMYRLRQEPRISASALARATFVTRQSMGAVLQQLLDRGLVTRPERADSGRELPTELTPAGMMALDAAEILVAEVESRMTSTLARPGLQALSDGLAACISALA